MTDLFAPAFVASLATAAIVNVWMHGSLFAPLRAALVKYTTDATKPNILRKLAFGPTCQHCFTHWVGFAAAAASMPDATSAAIAAFPIVWLASHSIAVFTLINAIPGYLNASVKIAADEARARAYNEYLAQRRVSTDEQMQAASEKVTA